MERYLASLLVNPCGKEPMHNLHMTYAHQEQTQAVSNTLGAGQQYRFEGGYKRKCEDLVLRSQSVPNVLP